MSKQSFDMLVVVYQDKLQLILCPCDNNGTRRIDRYNVVSSRPFVKISLPQPRRMDHIPLDLGRLLLTRFDCNPRMDKPLLLHVGIKVTPC